MDLNPPFSLVWFKRDLRIRDHKPLCDAINRGLPILLAYIVEPEQIDDPHMDIRHWRFITESIDDINQQLVSLKAINSGVHMLHGELTDVLAMLKTIGLQAIYSHQEVGLLNTFERDKAVASWCRQNQVDWYEAEYGAVTRPLSHRYNWRKDWHKRIRAANFDPDLSRLLIADTQSIPEKYRYCLPDAWRQTAPAFQRGGERRAWHTLKHFLIERGKGYFGNIGKPMEARRTCSRLSPYLAWGNISIKQAYQYIQPHKERPGWKRSIEALCSRLAWHCHFIQKFESEHFMQHRPVNRAYAQFPYVDSDTAIERFKAWQQAKTGVPIIDASMRAVKQTGYLNFRMRAMLVSFLCHHLNVDWQLGVTYLGSQFLDFEPGIHYPQFQMQAGITGTNTIRIYNPIKQSIDKDPDGEFIKKWLPELAALPIEFLHEPHTLPPIDAALLDFDIERDYYLPIIDVRAAAREARDRLWSFRKRDDVQSEAKRVLHSHSVLN